MMIPRPSMSRRPITSPLLLYSYLFLLVQGYTSKKPPFLRRQDMTGIWKLTHQSLQLPTITSLEDQTYVADKEQEIVLRLNDDGTFDPYTTTTATPTDTSTEGGDDANEFHHILERGGSWKYQDENLILAPERPECADPSQVHDTTLRGKLVAHVSECLPTGQSIEADDTEQAEDIDVHLSIPKGKVSIGKFMYPKKHNAFFEEPMLFHKSSIGTFSMNQLLGNLNARLKSEQKQVRPEAKFHKKDFHDRQFYLTATPHKVNPQYAAQDKRYNEDQVLHDLRVMPITFHANNTFAAQGTEKILRGRYGIAGKKRDRFWFQVSLFGAGRSAPGSVYSEGRLLSHDDRRGYVGPIQEYEQSNRTMFHVAGDFFYGTDLKQAKKPNSMGTFTLQEIAYVDKAEEKHDPDSHLTDGWDDTEEAFQ